MLNSTYLDMAIGMVFIFLLYSILATAILEIVATVFKLRGRYLFSAIVKMLKDQHLGQQLARDFRDHPLMRKMNYTNRKALPSYITPWTFSIVLQDILPDYYLGAGQSLKAHEKILLLPDGEFKKSVLTLINIEGLTVDEALRFWFNISMERLSGAYKRMTQYVSFGIGLLLAITLNVNAISIFTRLTTDKAAREQLVRQAMAFYEKKSDSLTQADAIRKTRLLKRGKESVRLAKENTNNLNDQLAEDSILVSNFKEEQERVRQLLQDEVNYAGNTVGVGRSLLPKNPDGSEIWQMIFGWIITSLAITLGAPFWFDVLQKLVRIRGSGNKPLTNTEMQKMTINSGTLPK